MSNLETCQVQDCEEIFGENDQIQELGEEIKDKYISVTGLMNKLIEKYGSISNLGAVAFGFDGEISLNSYFQTLANKIIDIRIKGGKEVVKLSDWFTLSESQRVYLSLKYKMEDKLNFTTSGKEYVKIVGKKFFLGKDKDNKPTKIDYFTYIVLIPKAKPVEEVKLIEKVVETPEKKKKSKKV